MKKFILTFLFIAILISPISASAMNRSEVEAQYKEALMTVIILLTQQVNQLMRQLEGMQFDMIPQEEPQEIMVVEEKVETKPVEWVRPFDGYNPATPINKCHADGQLDVKVKCK